MPPAAVVFLHKAVGHPSGLLHHLLGGDAALSQQSFLYDEDGLLKKAAVRGFYHNDPPADAFDHAVPSLQFDFLISSMTGF